MRHDACFLPVRHAVLGPGPQFASPSSAGGVVASVLSHKHNFSLYPLKWFKIKNISQPKKTDPSYSMNGQLDLAGQVRPDHKVDLLTNNTLIQLLEYIALRVINRITFIYFDCFYAPKREVTM